MRTRSAITVRRSRDEAYRFWHDFEVLPGFMTHLESVKVQGEGRSHWVARGPLGTSVEWDAEIVTDTPNEVIARRSVDGADVDNSGTVTFTEAPGGRGTETTVEMEHRTPGGRLGAIVAKVFGEEPTQQLNDDLRRCKQIIETGEIVRSDGSPDGTRVQGLAKQSAGQPQS